MLQIKVETPVGRLTTEFDPHADFMTCLFPALIAAIPCFLQSFMSCLAGGGSSADYTPGNRVRCR